MKQNLDELKRQYDQLSERRKELDERLEQYSKNRGLLLGIGRLQDDPFEVQNERAAQREWASVCQQQAALLRRRPWWVRMFRPYEW